MTRTCPVLPRQEDLPFGADRTASWKIVHDAGDVAVSREGNFFLIGADVVEAASKNTEVFASEGAFGMLGAPFPLVPIGIDPPIHSRYRRMLNKFFSPRSVAEHEEELSRQLDDIIDGILENGPVCDVMSALAVPFPSQVFLTLFGLPLADTLRLIEWKNALVRLLDPQSAQTDPESIRAAAELVAYLTELIGQRRRTGGSDLLSLLMADRDEGEITDQEILGMCFIFVIAGLDTVTAAVGFAMNALAQDVELRHRVRTDDAAAAVFVEELLRVEGPIPFVPRRTTTAVEIGGVTIPEGSTCWLMFGAANRDPRRYEESDVIGDQRQSHFAFGRGPHRCLGSHLALLELRLVLERWLARIPDFSLVSTPEVLWPSATLAFERLEVRIGASP
jgi:cytochrome P450